MERETNVEKMRMESVDLISKNVEKIAELFPECVTEAADKDGALRRLVDFDKLRQLLSGDVAEEPERYDFTWVGKRAALAEAHTPVRKTLRPCPEESRDWDTTQNLYIEGDNLDVLKLLQESYLGKVKMIYIDPPYNTGSDSFVYPDNYRADDDEYEAQGKMRDKYGNKTFKENNDANPRFHSDWCSMIYSRLVLARNLMSYDGLLFVSISDHEIENLMKICNEIFGEKNFIADIIWNSTKSVTNTALISVSHTHNLVFSKDIDFFVEHRDLFRLKENGEGFDNPDNDPRGPWKADPFQVGGWRPNQQYEIINPNTGKVYRPNSGCSWKNDYKNYCELVKDNRIVFGVEGNAGPQRKRFLFEALDRGRVTKTLWDDIETTTNGTQGLKKLLGGKYFDNPKPISLLKRVLELATQNKSIVMDFFSGSSTTAHAVMQLNAEDGGNRRFIMVQLPEVCDEKTEAAKAGYSNICEIGKERIRRAGDKIKAENPLTTKDLDIGFRVLKVDSTNMNDVYYGASEVSQDLIKSAESNVKDDRTDLDLLFGCLLDWGLPLSLPYKSEEIDGVTIHDYNGGDLIACFAEKVSETVVTTIAKRKPIRAVFRDSCFETDAAKINVTELFKRYAPDARVKTI